MKKNSAKSIQRQKRLNGKRSATTPNRQTARRLLGAGGAVLAGSLAGFASAATTSVTAPLTGAFTLNATGQQVILASLANLGAVEAEVLDTFASVVVDQIGDQTINFNASVDDNAIAAVAIGSGFDSLIDLALIDSPAVTPPGGSGTGIASLNFAVNGQLAAPALITSSVERSGFSTVFDADLATTTSSVDGNLILAQTTINTGISEVTGKIPVSYSSTTEGSASLVYAVDAIIPEARLDTEATVTVSTLQLAIASGEGAGSFAEATDNFARLTQDPGNVDATLDTVGFTLDRNIVAAQFTGNEATTTAPIGSAIDPDDNGANGPLFSGSVAVTSVQANLADALAPDNIAALASNTQIQASIGNPDDGGEGLTVLSGSLSVSMNAVEAGATGNRAASLVSLADNLSFNGATSASPGSSIDLDGSAPLPLTADVDADLLLLSSQANQLSALTSRNEDTEISAYVQSLNQGQVNVDRNSVTARTTGNTASNEISAEGANAFSGSLALASLQVNEQDVAGGDRPIDAQLAGASVSTTIGADIDDADPSRLIDSQVSMDRTNLAASATGNRVANTIDLNGNNLALGANGGDDNELGSIVMGSRGNPDADVFGGASLTNLQMNSFVGVRASNDGSEILLTAVDLEDGVAISGSDLDITRSTISASALGSSAINAFSASNTNSISGSFVLGSFQAADQAGVAPDGAQSVVASVDDALILMEVGDLGVAILGSDLTVTDNTIAASGTINFADSSLDLNATGATVAGGAGIVASTVDLAGFDTDAPHTVNAAYGVFGLQLSNADVSATVTADDDFMIAITAGGDVGGAGAGEAATLILDRNTISASAAGNDGLNALDLNATNLSVDGGGHSPVANVTNVQVMNGELVASVTGDDLSTIGIDVFGDVTSSTLSASDNAISASVVGNRARANGGLGNVLEVTGTNLNALSGAALGGLSLDTTDGEVTADAAFSVQNVQSAGRLPGDPEAITATVTDVGVTIESGAVTDSSVTADSNEIGADAGANQAFNRAGLTGLTSLAGSVGLNSYQQSLSDVGATVAPAFLAFDVTVDGDLTRGEVSVSSNRIDAVARSNLAGNEVEVGAGTLTLAGDGNATANTAGSVFTTDLAGIADGQVSAGIGLLASQFAGGDTTATITDPSVGTGLFGAVSFSDIDVNGNIVNATATGNQSTSRMMLDLGSLIVEGVGAENSGPIGAVASQQALAGNVRATTSEVQFDIAAGDAGDSITDSELSISGNIFQNRAVGNQAMGANGAAGNSLTVTGNGLSDVADGPITGMSIVPNADGFVMTADAGFTVQNMQLAGGDILASLEGPSELAITAFNDGDVERSSLTVSGNQVFNRAVGNLASNALDLNGLTNVTGSGGVNSGQASVGAVNAFTGFDGTNVTPLEFTIDVASTLNTEAAIDGNLVFTTAIGNDVINSASVDANSITGGGALPADSAGASMVFDDTDPANRGNRALADFGVSSLQFIEGAGVTAVGHVQATLTSGEDAGGDTTSSSLSVSGNAQEVRALGNRGVNELLLSATNNDDGGAGDASATGALVSDQGGRAPVSASAFLTAEATGAMASSTLSMSSNFNAAEAVLNSVTNTVSASGTNLATANTGNATAINLIETAADDDRISSAADFSLASSQFGSQAVTATAETTIANLDEGTTTALNRRVADSSVSLQNNVTSARAVSNEALNGLSIEATNLAATGALANRQLSSGTVGATATADIIFNLDNVDPSAAAVSTGSTLNLSGNVTQAAASGNRANNGLAALAGANYQDVSAAGASGSFTGLATGSDTLANATYGVLNFQDNSGGVTAGVAGATHLVSLTGTGVGTEAVDASSIRVNNNQILADANGNFARNTLSMSARPGGNASGALTSGQTNAGGISASITASTMGATLDGGTGSVANSTASVTANRMVARATGNTAINRIVRGGE